MMNIYTDLVRNKKFASPIQSSLIKRSHEYRVLATLRYLYPTEFGTMIVRESPDLQDDASGIGIEVTAAVKEDDMRVAHIFSELCEGNQRDATECKNIIESLGYSFVPRRDGKNAITTAGTSDGEKVFFQKSIRRKTEKLQKYRINFQRIGLAILLPEIPTAYAEKHFSEWIAEFSVETENWFDFVYVISHRFCMHYNVKENTVEKHSLTQDESRLLSTIGRMTAEGELVLTNPEWL